MAGSRRLLMLAGLVLGLVATPCFADQPVPSDPWQAFAAAKAREEAARTALQRSRSEASRAEQAATSAAGTELALREREIAELAAIEAQIDIAFDRLVHAGKRSPILGTELAVLEEWYGNLQGAAGHLTDRSFIGLEAELEGMGKAGLVRPGTRRFSRLSEVRAAIQNVQREIERQIRDGDSIRAQARADIARLAAQHDALLARVATENPGPALGASDWAARATQAGRDAVALLDAQQAVLAAYQRLADEAHRQRPPALIGVAASGDGGQFYNASWTTGDGNTPDEHARQAERSQILETRQRLGDALGSNRALRQELATGRYEIGERMAVRSRLLEQSAARYGNLQVQAVVVGVAADIGLSAAEILLTGGTATLARQTAKLAAEAAERATARATASTLIEGATSAEKAVLRAVARSGDAPSDVARRAALLAEESLREKAPALLDRLVAEGMPVERAAMQVETIIAGTVARLRDLERISRLGNRGVAETISAAHALDALGSRLPGTAGLPSAEVLREMIKDESITKGVGNLRDLYKRYLSEDRNLPPEFQSALAEASTAGDTAMAELIETAFAVGVNTWQASAPEGLTRMGKFTAKFGQGMTRNAASLGLGVVTSAIEVAVAANYDRLINQEGKHFATLLGELEYLNDIYLGELAKDEKLAAIAAQMAGDLAAADRRLAQIDAALRQQPTVSRAGRAEGLIRIELAFSSPLAAAPTVRVGSQALAVQAIGTDGRRWAGSVSGKTLGAGTHRLEVAIDRTASPHGALDTNLATAPLRAFGPQRWTGFEPGVDQAHAIRLDPASQELAASEQCPANMPSGTPALVCQCPAPATTGTVWGTYYYTDDSRLCSAAVHAGAIPASGGAISVRAAPGRDYYTASSANGIASNSYGRWARSIVFDRVQSAEAALGNIPICGGTFDGHGGAAGPPVCRCLTIPSGSIWGSGPYTSDSSICRAALHAGVISGSGGVVRVMAAPGQKEYRGSTANGVTTSGWGSYPRSFTVSQAN